MACLGCRRVYVRICTMAKRAATIVGQGSARAYLQGRDAKPTQLQALLAGLILLCVVCVDAAVYIGHLWHGSVKQLSRQGACAHKSHVFARGLDHLCVCCDLDGVLVCI